MFAKMVIKLCIKAWNLKKFIFMIGLFQFCLKLNKIFAKIIIKLCIKHEFKKKSIHMYPWVFYCIYISIYKNVFVWSGIFCDLLRWSECEKMFIFVNERFHLCIYIYRIWSVQKSGIDKCHILCCSLLNGFSMIFTVHEWNVRLQYTSYSFNFWGWEFINCYVSFLVEYIYICMHVLPLDLGR